MTDQHAQSFYKSGGDVNGMSVLSFVRREIGKALTDRIIRDHADGTVLLSHISPTLLLLDSECKQQAQPFQKNSQDPLNVMPQTRRT